MPLRSNSRKRAHAVPYRNTLKIEYEDVALPSVFSVMLREKVRHPGYGEIVPFAAQARSVVVNE